MKKIASHKNTYLLFLLVISLLGIVISTTYAKFSDNYTTEEDIVGLSLDFNIGITNIEEYEQIEVGANQFTVFDVEIENISSSTMYYGIWSKLNTTETNPNIIIAKLAGTETATSDSIDGDSTKKVSIIINNKTKEKILVDIGVASSTTNTSDIEYLGGKSLITGTAKEEANNPNLDTGLIPVYYDNGVWKKADASNKDNSWYDYNSQKWANAILVSDETKRNTYQNAKVGDTITETDITAFYVWIPRFKYRVWNITRQAGTEDSYSYPAYTEGIDIKFESSTTSTGNLKCTYDTSITATEDTLSDTCTYNDTYPITTESVNTDYPNAWYTHPAFTFGDKEVTGFWIGKFETTGTSKLPTILPDEQSLREQIVSEQFTTSKTFQNYGLSNNIDAHMLTNLEWGAVAYLTHSTYGLCKNNSCRDAYINNSTDYYTGRSGGALAQSGDLRLVNVYGTKTTTSTEQYNTTGYYDYQGYFIDYSGNITTIKDISKVASTTGNITGVYDMVGGSYEQVMANMVDNNNAFYPVEAGTTWNGSTTLNNKYYTSYSNGTKDSNQPTLNRARLGDGLAETVVEATNKSSWNPGDSLTYSSSKFVNNNYAWILRGGHAQSEASTYDYTYSNGSNQKTTTFRSSLS